MPVVATPTRISPDTGWCYCCQRPFPRPRRQAPAAGRRGGQDTTLVAEVDGVALFCADHPVPSRLVGADQALVLAAAQLLGLR
jgi:hypothetical protein